MTIYTRRERQSIASTFRAVLDVLPDTLEDDWGGHRSPYICDNIDVMADNPVADMAKDVIQERIDCKFSLGTWLCTQSNKIRKEVKFDVDHCNGVKLQAYRKAWLESLIKEFSK